jgi:hypothetical protein
MELSNSLIPLPMKRRPWNKGKLVGTKTPLRSKHVWSIRTKLQLEGRKRDLALFNLATDTKLRGCDVVAVKVEDVAPNGYAIDRAAIPFWAKIASLRGRTVLHIRIAGYSCLSIVGSRFSILILFRAVSWRRL